jgi:hypothetical protein
MPKKMPPWMDKEKEMPMKDGKKPAKKMPVKKKK